MKPQMKRRDEMLIESFLIYIKCVHAHKQIELEHSLTMTRMVRAWRTAMIIAFLCFL